MFFRIHAAGSHVLFKAALLLAVYFRVLSSANLNVIASAERSRFGDEVQYGNNILGSSDSWSRYGRGTNGLWYAPEPYSHFTVALVREGRTLTTFINGMVDQWTDGDFRLERLLLGGSGSNIDGYALYGRALTPAEIAVLISQCR